MIMAQTTMTAKAAEPEEREELLIFDEVEFNWRGPAEPL